MSTTVERLSAALAERYRIERELGAGGMATVYLAHDLKHDRDVAIKVLRPELTESLTGGRFVREIAVTARLNYPHILALLDSGEVDGGSILYYVMPLATGESLRDRLDRDGAIPIREALRLSIEVIEALSYAHAQGVVHRDIKPANILLSGGHAVVADFGIAKAIGNARDTPTLTTAGTSLGTPTYMAPEQATGESDIDHRADLYAAGVMLYEMLAGVPPFVGTWTQVVAEKLSRDAPSVTARCPASPPALARLVTQCMARDPAERPGNAGEVLAELRAIVDAQSAQHVAAGARTPARLVIGGAAIAVAALTVLSFLFVRDRRTRCVHQTAIPAIERLAEADQLDSAFALAATAAARAPNDTAIDALWDRQSQTQTFLSDPVGAVVTRAAVNDTTRWLPVGTTPTAPVRIPNNAWFYRYAKPGYRTVTVMGARLGGSYVPIPSPVPLRRLADPDTDMVMLLGSSLAGTLYGLAASGRFDLADFLMDKLEVTNRQYKAFVDAEGYTTRVLWDSIITKDGRSLAWNAAMVPLADKTGRPGPSTWEGGAPPRAPKTCRWGASAGTRRGPMHASSARSCRLCMSGTRRRSPKQRAGWCRTGGTSRRRRCAAATRRAWAHTACTTWPGTCASGRRMHARRGPGTFWVVGGVIRRISSPRSTRRASSIAQLSTASASCVGWAWGRISRGRARPFQREHAT